MAPGGHLGFMQITGVAQSCQSGNQAEFTRRGHVSTDQQKSFIGKNTSRLVIGYIKVSNRLIHRESPLAKALKWSDPLSLTKIWPITSH